jgi:hypothetical protein
MKNINILNITYYLNKNKTTALIFILYLIFWLFFLIFFNIKIIAFISISFERIIITFPFIIYFPYIFIFALIDKLYFHNKLKLLQILIEKDLDIKEIFKLKKILLFKKFPFNKTVCINYAKKDLIVFNGEETLHFLSLITNYLMLEIYLKSNNHFNEIYESYLEVKTVLGLRDKWEISKELNEVSIYNIRINEKLFLTHFLKYKYTNKEAKEEILFLLKDKNINEFFLKEEGLSEEDINYCLKRIENKD